MIENKIFVLSVISFLVTIVSSQSSIHTQIACEWEALKLECRRGEILSIVSANYGRTSSAICKFQGSTNCVSAGALNIVKNNCEGRPSCTVMARNDVFGDPCEGTIKYLEAQYQCKPAPACNADQFRCDDTSCISKSLLCNGKKECPTGEDERGCNYKTAYGCEGGSLNIECQKGELIRVLHGDYGRDNAAICHYDQNVNCRSPVANNILKDRCDLRRNCNVPANNDIFGDPCHGTYKYIQLHYTCWQIPLR